MRKINRKLGIVQMSALLVVAFLAATPAAKAQKACELDWNGDGVVNWSDYSLSNGGITSTNGFSDDLYSYLDTATGLHATKPNPDLDWNGDGVIDTYDDDDFYAQLQIFIDWYLRGYHQEYEQRYPNSDCIDIDIPLPTPSKAYHECVEDWIKNRKLCEKQFCGPTGCSIWQLTLCDTMADFEFIACRTGAIIAPF